MYFAIRKLFRGGYAFRMKREPGENPGQYPLLWVHKNGHRTFATGVISGSGLHRRTDKTNCQPATRGVQGKALFKGVQGEVQDGALNGNSGEEPAGERKIQAVH